MAFVDLHLHTTFSDGVLTPSDLVKLAAANGVGTMAITDHDNTDGLEEGFSAAAEAGIAIIPGIEISTSWYGKPIHLATYGFRRGDASFDRFLKEQFATRQRYYMGKLDALAAIRKEKGLPVFSVEDFIAKNGGFFNGTKTAEFLVSTGQAPDFISAKEALLGLSSDETFVSPEEAIAAAHQAGAVVCLAHPLAPKISLKNIDPDKFAQKKLVAQLKSFGLDGIECYQAGHASADTQFALEMAEEFGLVVSAGSDWHGPISILGEGMRKYIPFYVEAPGGLKTPASAVAPLLERLGVGK